jgi:hypothetical protein
MSVDTDYARVVETMRHPLPAYVAYVQRNVVRMMGAVESESRIVVRTADKQVVHGHAPREVVIDKGVFDPACYRPTGEASASRNGRNVLSFALASTCNGTDKNPFTMLYVDPVSMRPIEATAIRRNESVRVSVSETFSTVREWSLPASLKVDIEGSGLVFWLQVHALQTFSNYGFYASDPGAGTTAPAPGE